VIISEPVFKCDIGYMDHNNYCTGLSDYIIDACSQTFVGLYRLL